MSSRTENCYVAGWTAIGLGSIMASPLLPLRLALPACALLAALFYFRTDRRVGGFRVAGAYALFWMLACIVMNHGNGAQQPWTLLLLLAGLCLMAPAILRGFQTSKDQPNMMDIGVAGSAIAIVSILLMAGLGPHPVNADSRARLVMPLMVGISAWFASRGALRADAPRCRKVLLVSFAAVTAASLIPTCRLAMTSTTARHHAARGNIVSAFRAELAYERLASQLGMASAQVASLRRQADLAGTMNNRSLRRTKLRALTQLTDDGKAWRWLLDDALECNEPSLAIEAFMHIPSPEVSHEHALRIAAMAASDRNPAAFRKVWAVLGDEIPESALPHETLQDWGRSGYFEGDADFAMFCLVRSLQTDTAPWDALRLLWQLYVDAEAYGNAEALLDAYRRGDQHAEEFAYLRSEIRSRKSGPLSSLPPCQESGALGVFAGSLHLVGASPPPDPVFEGHPATVRFEWRTTGPVNPKWKVFVHLREQLYGGSFFQFDHRFADVGRLPSEWALGTAFTYDHHMPLPMEATPGRYAILVGVWDGKHRLQVTQQRGAGARPGIASDQIEVGILEILPRL